MADKIVKLRIFSDEAGPDESKRADVGGEILSVSASSPCTPTPARATGRAIPTPRVPKQASRLDRFVGQTVRRALANRYRPESSVLI